MDYLKGAVAKGKDSLCCKCGLELEGRNDSNHSLLPPPALPVLTHWLNPVGNLCEVVVGVRFLDSEGKGREWS